MSDRDARIGKLLEGWEPIYPMTVSTIAQYLYVGQGVVATCRACRHETTLDLLTIGEKLGRDTRVNAVLNALVCTQCGRRGRPDVLTTSRNRSQWAG